MAMRGWILIFLINLLGTPSFAQEDDRKNRKPRIIGQEEIIIDEDTSYEIKLINLDVYDRDDWFYPWGFTLHVYEGEHYTFSGTTVKPSPDFNGTLSVKVTVHDGEDHSDTYQFKIKVRPVNDRPVIVSQSQIPKIEQEKTGEIKFEHLQVSDPDDDYPNGFSLVVLSSSNDNYLVSGRNITPTKGSLGIITVPILVNDGQENSEPFNFEIDILPGNDKPRITGQKPIAINEDESIDLTFDHFTVEDDDDQYPQDFQLIIVGGKNYNVTSHKVTPSRDYYGKLEATVKVNDGKTDSDPFTAIIDVLPVNDPPEIIAFETEPVPYDEKESTVQITKIFEVRDVENDSIAYAEIGFLSGTFHPEVDELIFDRNSNLKGDFNIGNGTLRLQGPASPSAFNEAIRSVQYNNKWPDQTIRQNKIIFIQISDGQATAEVTRIVQGNELVAELDIPTAFTPNGDAANDTWKITPLALSDEIRGPIVRVYNPKGIMLFETTGFDHAWDGRHNGELLPAGVYYYTIDFNVPNAKNTIKGAVAILR